MKVTQAGYIGGELSPTMMGRIDDSKYQMGLAVCRNFVCLPQGPVQNRAGFAFVRETKYSDRPCRLIAFRYSSSQTMVLEVGDKYIRFHTEEQTLLGDDGLPYEVVTPYAAEDVFGIHYTQSADIITFVHPSYAPAELKRYSALDWRLENIEFGAPLDAPTGLEGTYTCAAKSDVVTDAMKTLYTIKYVVTAVRETNAGIEESEASEPCSVVGNLYLDASKIELTWTEKAGADRYRVYKTYSGIYGYIGETETASFTDSNIEAENDKTPPRYDDPFYQQGGIKSITVTNGGSGYLGPRRVTGIKPGTFQVYFAPNGDNTVWTYSNSLPPYPDSSYGISVYSGANMANPWDLQNVAVTSSTGTGAKISFVFEEHVQSNGHRYVEVIGYKVESGGSGYSPDDRWKGSVVRGSHLRHGIAWNYPITTEPVKPEVRITDPTGSGAEAVAAIDENGVITEIRVLKSGAGYTNPTVTILENGTGGSGATATAEVGQTGDYPGAVSYFQQRRIFAGSYSRPQFVWMTRPGTEYDMSYTLPQQDDNRIKFRVATNEASRIRHVVPLQSLILLTESAEFRVATANDDALTPTSVDVRAQAYIGASDVQPLLVNSTCVYAAERGGHIRELGYQYQAGGFVTGDMSLRADHLFVNKEIVDLAYAKAPVPIVWAVNSAGQLLGCTYIPEQNVAAWHRHDTVNGSFESVACVSEGIEDSLYAVVRRIINNKEVRYIERMRSREFTNLASCFFVDCGAVYEGDATDTVSGLAFLEGETVAILADGKVMPQQKVENGKISLPIKAGRIVIGLPIEADMQTLPVVLQDRSGGAGRGLRKNVSHVWVRVYQSSGMAAGPAVDQLSDYASRTTEPYGTPPDVITGERPLLTAAKWSDGGQIWVRQRYPLPLTVCATTVEVVT